MIVPAGGAVDPGRRLGVAILGSTGSIGTQTLEVIEHHPDRFRVVALAAGSNAELLGAQVRRHRPALVVSSNPIDSITDVPPGTRFAYGHDGLVEAAIHPEADIVVVASSGHSAIAPTLEAIRLGKIIALANKESIVCAGELIVPLARASGAQIRPVDSEHSAIWQSMDHGASRLSRLILTASGGPFRTVPLDNLRSVTVDQALSHPTWKMGGKITIDSATMMNKGLELIEAHWLFGIDYDNIDIIVHPESIVHSIVEYDDGSQIAQLSLPDMRLPIQFALTYPSHELSPCQKLRLEQVNNLSFYPLELERYPAVRLARESGRAGRSYPTVLSAADEVAVEAFLQGAIGFLDIIPLVQTALDAHDPVPIEGVGSIFEADGWARRFVAKTIDRQI